MSYDNKLPPIPNNCTNGIGIIFHTGYDTNDIKIVQDVVQTIISRNRNAKFIICCDIERAAFWIREYLKIYYIPHENITWVADPFHIERPAYSSTVMRELFKFRDTISRGNVSNVYIFTDNPKATEVIEVIKASDLFNFRVYTINSDSNFTDHKTERTTNQRAFIEGRTFTNDGIIHQNQKSISRRGFTTGESK